MSADLSLGSLQRAWGHLGVQMISRGVHAAIHDGAGWGTLAERRRQRWSGWGGPAHSGRSLTETETNPKDIAAP